MPASDAHPFRLYRDEPFFREALSATAAAMGFPARLIEKDYFCSVILQHLGSSGLPLVFKGGTMLTKIHAGFYRLSEDLDFSVSTPADTPRSQRSRLARPLRSALDAIEGALPGVVLRQRLLGANNSTQYSALIAYQSLLGAAEETIKFEVGLREPLLRQPVRGTVKTLLLDPISGVTIVPGFEVSCLSSSEAMAEKLRAAMCRRDVAIRDYFDIDHAARRGNVRLDDPEMLDLVSKKVAVQGKDPPNMSAARLRALQSQVETELAPVVRAADLASFDLERAFAAVSAVAAAIGHAP